MVHDRKLVLGGISLTQARLRGVRDLEALTFVRDELEREMIESAYLDGAPFKWVGIIIRYGLKDDQAPEFARINRKHGDLPLAIEIDTHKLLNASYEQLVLIFRKATLIALVNAGEKYGLKSGRMKLLLTSMVAGSGIAP